MKEVCGNILWGLQTWVVYPHKPPNTNRATSTGHGLYSVEFQWGHLGVYVRYIYILPAVSKAMEYILRLHWAGNRLTELKFMHYLPAMLIISVKMFMRTKVCGYKFSCIGIQLQKKLYLAKISHYRDNSASCTYQQSSMSLYISFEQPGGGGSLCPSLTRDITWNGSDSQDWHEYGDLSWSLKSHRHQMCAYMHAIEYLKIVYEFKRFCPQWPDFIENHTIAPHITGSSELAGVEGLQLQTANKILIHTLPASFSGLLQPSWKKGENFLWKAWEWGQSYLYKSKDSRS